MKHIIEAYGRFLFTGAAFLLGFLLLFANVRDEEGNKGALRIIGARLPATGIDYAGYADYSSYLNEGVKGMPSITFEYAGKIYAGEDMRAADFIKGRDSSGHILALRILKISDPSGNDITSCYDKSTGNICFPFEGVCLVQAAVRDTANKKYTCSVAVPVNRK